MTVWGGLQLPRKVEGSADTSGLTKSQIWLHCAVHSRCAACHRWPLHERHLRKTKSAPCLGEMPP